MKLTTIQRARYAAGNYGTILNGEFKNKRAKIEKVNRKGVFVRIRNCWFGFQPDTNIRLNLSDFQPDEIASELESKFGYTPGALSN